MTASVAPASQTLFIPQPRRGRERFLVVRLAGKEFALEAFRILATMQMRTLELLPIDGPPGWKSLVEFQGRLLPVYCPNLAAGVAERPMGPRTCLLLVGAPESPQQPAYGLQVDSVSRFEDLSPISVRRHASGGCSVRLRHRWRPVLDLAAIASYWVDREWLDRKPTTS